MLKPNPFLALQRDESVGSSKKECNKLEASKKDECLVPHRRLVYEIRVTWQEDGISISCVKGSWISPLPALQACVRMASVEILHFLQSVI